MECEFDSKKQERMLNYSRKDIWDLRKSRICEKETQNNSSLIVFGLRRSRGEALSGFKIL